MRFLPWLLVAVSVLFASVTWSDLPAMLPMRLAADGTAVGVTEKSFLAWFGLPLAALATVGLLTGVRAAIPKRPDLFNHPDNERFLALPPAFRHEVFAEIRLVLDATSLLVAFIMIEVQAFLFAAASGRPSSAAIPVIVVTAIATGPVLLLTTSRITAAVERAERRWTAAGRPTA